MQGIRGQRHGAQAWRAMLAQHADSGLTVAAFCRRKAISAASFYQWRSRLGAQASAVPARLEHAGSAGFVDMGMLQATDSIPAVFELRLDLGGGLTLQLRRG